MVNSEDLLISQMISFVDELMLFANPEINQFNEDDRMKVILLFFCRADLIRSPTAGQSDDRWAITENALYGTRRNISRERDYRSMALDCLSRPGKCCVDDNWRNFATSLARTFSREEEPFFRWLNEARTIVEAADQCTALKELSDEHRSIAALFALAALFNASLRRSQDHYQEPNTSVH
jgi:hypothetical protein